MKQYLLTLLFIYCTILFSYAQQLQWARQQGGTLEDVTNGISIDGQGNIITVGTFDGTASTGCTALTAAGNFLDVFIAKYDSTGNCIWSRKAGGTSGDRGLHVVTDAAHAIYVCGVIGQATALFESVSIPPITGAIGSGFIAKYTAQGNLLWVKNIGGIGSRTECRRLAVKDNKLYVAGTFTNTASFGPSISLTSNSASVDIFLARFDTAGIAQWAVKGGGRNAEQLADLKLDLNGSPVVYGQYDSLTTFMSTTTFANISTISSLGDQDLFLVKYDNAGNEIWFKSFGGEDTDEPGGICFDQQNNIYVNGNFKTYFKAGSAINITYFTNSFNLFLLKLSSSGNPLWSKYSGNGESIGYQKGVALTLSENKIYSANTFGGNYKAGSSNFSAVGDRNPMTLVYDTSGNILWGAFAKGVSSFQLGLGTCVATYQSKVYSGGFFYGNFRFNDTSLTAPGVSSDGFVAVYRETPVSQVPNPTALFADSTTSRSILLKWDGPSAEFRVLMKLNSSSTNKDDGILIYEGPNKQYQISGLLPSQPYFFTVYGKASGIAQYSNGNKKLANPTLPDTISDGIVIGVLAGDTTSRLLPAASLSFAMLTPSGTDGYIKIDIRYNLTQTGTLPTGVDSIYTDRYWVISNNGLTGSALRFCVKMQLSFLGSNIDTANYTLLRRRDPQDTWENIQTNPMYTVTYDLPASIQVCNLNALGEFVIAKKLSPTGIAEMQKRQVTVYPNPASEHIFINSDVPFEPQSKITLYNIVGTALQTFDTGNQSSVAIHLKNYPKGIYWLLINGNSYKISLQ